MAIMVIMVLMLVMLVMLVMVIMVIIVVVFVKVLAFCILGFLGLRFYDSLIARVFRFKSMFNGQPI